MTDAHPASELFGPGIGTALAKAKRTEYESLGEAKRDLYRLEKIRATKCALEVEIRSLKRAVMLPALKAEIPEMIGALDDLYADHIEGWVNKARAYVEAHDPDSATDAP